MAPTTKADWTVMVFLNAKNNLEPFSFGNCEQMAKVGSTDQVNVVVEFGRPSNTSRPSTAPGRRPCASGSPRE